MSDKSRDNEKALRALFNELAEGVLRQSEEELLAEMKKEGTSPDQVSQDVTDSLLATVATFKRRKLLKAREDYENSIADLRSKNFTLPSRAEDRRSLLQRLWTEHTHLQGLLTIQGREFKDLTDSDIESLLKQLIELGLLSPHDEDTEA